MKLIAILLKALNKLALIVLNDRMFVGKINFDSDYSGFLWRIISVSPSLGGCS